MFVDLFYQLRKAGVPVSVTELITLNAALDAGLSRADVDQFYQLCRTTLVKDERHYDRFDTVFGAYMQGVDTVMEAIFAEIPSDWLARSHELELSEEERHEVESMGGWEALMEAFKERLQEQRERHEGGNRWIGTAGTSPFGAFGNNPEGIRISQGGSRNRSAVKVWEKREFKNLDDNVELGIRNTKMALRRLRKFTREGAAEELDLESTISNTARQAGLLDIHLRPERRNAVKVLLCLDVGGSMDYYIQQCEELFSAARSEFKQLEYFYFHNYIYENLWRDNRRRHEQSKSTLEIIRTYGKDYKLIFVGDAAMSPYEISAPGGSVEHWNEEPGALWMQRLLDHFAHAVWLNPEPEQRWLRVPSTRLIHQQMDERMFALTPKGIEAAMQRLTTKA